MELVLGPQASGKTGIPAIDIQKLEPEERICCCQEEQEAVYLMRKAL